MIARGWLWVAVVTLSFRSGPYLAEGAVTVTIDPKSAVTVRVNGIRQFTAMVSGATDASVTWSLTPPSGVSASAIGSIDANGTYTAPPATLPGFASLTVTARSVEQPTVTASTTITVLNRVPSVSAVSPPSLPVGAFSLSVSGSKFVPGAQVKWNGVPLSTTFVSASQLTATGTATQVGSVALTVANPGLVVESDAFTLTVTPIQDPQAITSGRFLEQSTFGPTPALMARVRQVGIPAFLEEQLAMPESPWPDSAATRADAIDAFYANAFAGQDQLRQRVIFALSEIFVVSMNKNTNGNEIVPWLELLSRNAFGNYRTLLKQITRDATMGKFLDLANSGVGQGAPNENYPREVMQLFSIGVSLLNPDGSVQTDASGNPIPAYTQTDVQQLARALTGWTYSNATKTTGSGGNWNYYPGPMIPVPGKHITSAKTVLGNVLPANQTINQDLDGAIDIIFNHPNVGPFVATRLIRALVTSNPSPAYIARVAQAFNGSAGSLRGDMPTVLRAILLDPEARNDSPPSTFGRLRTPMQHTIALCRALGIDPGPASQFAYLFYDMNEGLLDAPSVFGHYSPLFRIPRSPLFGPEFQIYTVSDATNRANWFYYLIYNPWPINPALGPYVGLASNHAALVAAVDSTLLYGRMLPKTRAAIIGALPAMYDDNQRVLTALYLTLMSGEYLVQH